MAASVPPPLVALVAVLVLLAGRTSAVSSARTGEEAVSALAANEEVVTVTADGPTDSADAEVVGSSATNVTSDPADSEAEVLTDDDRSDNLAALLTRRKAGCTYGGQLYAPGESIKSTEPCLNCTCHPVSLSITCHLRVCPTYPVPPPTGCFLVTRNGRCCSELICDHDINSVRRDQRRDDVPVTDADVSELTAELAAESLPHGSDGSCTVAGTVYADGSAMLTSSRCQYCFCIRGRQRCVQPKCTLREAGCRPRYRALDTCCPTDYDCQSITTTTTTTTTTTQKPSRDCTSGGRRYKEGSRIVDLTRPCRSCFCLRGHVRCAPVQCSPALEGCAPIIEPGKCCPVSYNCSAGLPEEGLVARTTLDKELIEDEAEDEDVTASQTENESEEIESGRPVSFARSANPPPAEVAVGVGSVVPVAYGSIVPVDHGSVVPVGHGSAFPVDSVRAGPPQLPAASVSFRLHVKSDPLVISKWDRRRVQENGAGLLTVRDLVLSGNEIASRRRSVDVPLRAEEASHDPEVSPEQDVPGAEIETESAPAEEQSAVSGETEAELNADADLFDSEEGSGDAPGAEVSQLMDVHDEPSQPEAAASHSPVLMTGAFAGFSGQAIPMLHDSPAIPILADSEDEQRIEDALAAVEDNVEGSGEPHPELTVTNIFRAVLSEIEESRQQASQEVVDDVPAETPGAEPLPEPLPEPQAEKQDVMEQQVSEGEEDIADESDEIIPVTVGSAADFVSMLADDAVASASTADDGTPPMASEVNGESDVEGSGLAMDETVEDSTTTDEMIQTAVSMVKELAMVQTKEESKIMSEKLASESEKEAQALPSEENDNMSQEVHKTMIDEASDSMTQVEPKPISESKPEPESAPISEPGAEAEAKPEPEMEPKSEPESKPESELDSESKPEPAPEPVPEPESKPESTSDTSLEPEAEPVAEPESQPDSTSEPAPEPASDEISEPGSEPEPASEPIPEPESEPESAFEQEPASEPKPASESRTEIVADPKPGHMTGAALTSEPIVDSEPVTSSEPKQEPSLTPEQGLDSENEPEPETEPEPELEPTPESASQPDAEEIPVSELEVEHKSGIETDFGQMFQSELSPESDAEVTPDADDSMPNKSVPAEPEPEPVSEAEGNSTPEPGSMIETGNESESESTDEPNVQSKTNTEPGSQPGPSEQATQTGETNEEEDKADASGTITGESQVETDMETETLSEEQPTEQTTVEPTTRRPLRPLGFFSILDLLTGRRPGGIPNRIAPRIPPRIAPRIPPGGPVPAGTSSSAESTLSEMSESGSETDIPGPPSPLPAESENEQPIEENSAPTPGDLEAEQGIAGDSETTASNPEEEAATSDQVVPVSEVVPAAALEPEPTTTLRPVPTTTLRPVPTTPKERLALDVLQSAEFEEGELPPALPNLRIIPFVAADAVVNRYPDELSVEAISSRFGLTAADPPPQQDTRAPPDWCPVDGRLYRHGQMVYRPEEPCRTCRCYRGRVLCQSTECPAVPTGCRVRNRRGFCCPEIVCEEEEEETSEVEEEVTKELAELANAGPPLAPVNREPDYTTSRPDFTTSRPLPPDTLPRRRIRPKPVRLSDALASTTTEEPSRHPVLALDSLAFTRGGPAPIASGEDSEETTLTGDKPSRRPILPLFARPDLSSYRPAPRPRPRPTFPTTEPAPPTTPPPTTTPTTSGPPAFPFATQPTRPPPSPSTTTTTTTTTTATPPTKRPSIPPPERVTKRPAPAPQVTKRPLPPPFEETNDLATGGDPFSLFGALKLSGCNIFGRMYRLNTVIRELSDDCTVCRCTASGVNCSPTDC